MSSDESRDVELVQAFESFSEFLYLVARVMVRNLGLSRVLNPSDLVQATFVKAHQKGHTLRETTREAQRAWLRETLVNTAKDAEKHEKLRAAIHPDLAASDSDSRREADAWLVCHDLSPRSQAMRDEAIERIAKELSNLPEADREAVRLHVVHGLSHSQIAVELGTTKGAVSRRVARGKERIIRHMLKLFPDGI